MANLERGLVHVYIPLLPYYFLSLTILFSALLTTLYYSLLPIIFFYFYYGVLSYSYYVLSPPTHIHPITGVTRDPPTSYQRVFATDSHTYRCSLHLAGFLFSPCSTQDKPEALGFTAPMTQGAHRRSPSSPHASKPKLSRPALHRRGTSGFNRSISKLGSGQPKEVIQDDGEFDMAASFLNFWYVLTVEFLIAGPCRESCPDMAAAVIRPCGCPTNWFINGS